MAQTILPGVLRRVILNNEALVISGDSGGSFTQSVQTQNCVDITLAGNTSGALALISSGTATIAGGNNITLSQAGNAFTIIGPTTAGFTQSVQTQNCVDLSLSGNTSGALALISSGTATLAGGNNITLSQAGNAVTISAASQTVQTQSLGSDTLGISNLGNTSGTSGVVSGSNVQLILAGGNNVTLSQSINGSSATVTISAFNQSVQTQSLGSDTLGISNLGNTSGTSGVVSGSNVQFVLAGGNNITLSQSVNGSSATVTISAFNQSVQTQSLGSDTLGISNLGNTSGTSGVVSGSNVQLVLAGGNNITLSQSVNGSSATVTISAFTQSVQTQNAVDLSLSGNTSGALALISSGTAILAGGNNITLSQNGQSVTISAASQSVQTQNAVDITLAGNTAGTLALISSGTATLAGGSNVTLSQNGNAVSINAAPVLSAWHNAMGTGDPIGTTNNQLIVFPLAEDLYFPGNMTVSTVRLQVSCNMSVTSASSQAHTYTVYFALYTINGQSLSLLNSASTSFGSANTNRSFSTMYNGVRWITYDKSLFSNSSLTLGWGSNYVGAVMWRSSGTNHGFSIIGDAPLNLLGTGATNAISGTIGTSTNNVTTIGSFWGVGPGVFTATGAPPASFGITDLTYVSGGVLNGIPRVQFDNVFSKF